MTLFLQLLLAFLPSVARAALAVAPLAAPAQEPAPAPPVTPPVSPPVTPSAAPQLAPKELVPGELPTDASDEAKALWRALCAATAGAGAPAKVLGFDLRFEGRGWQPQSKSEADFNGAHLRYLEPGFVAWQMSQDGRRSLRGPQGDWLVPPKGAPLRLQGVELEEDRRQLDQIAQISRTFVHLIDARALRIRSLAVMPAPPFPLPASMLERAKALKWLDLLSPDFALARTGAKVAAAREVRAWIGVDAQSRLPQLAIVAEDDQRTIVHETALLVELSDYRPLDAFNVPHKLRTFPADFTRSPWCFAEQRNLELWLLEGSLRPKLAASDFEPPKK